MNKGYIENIIIITIVFIIYLVGNNFRYVESKLAITTTCEYITTKSFTVTDKKLDIYDTFNFCSLEVAEDKTRVIVPCTLLDLDNNIGDKVMVDIYHDKNMIRYVLK